MDALAIISNILDFIVLPFMLGRKSFIHDFPSENIWWKQMLNSLKWCNFTVYLGFPIFLLAMDINRTLSIIGLLGWEGGKASWRGKTTVFLLEELTTITPSSLLPESYLSNQNKLSTKVKDGRMQVVANGFNAADEISWALTQQYNRQFSQGRVSLKSVLYMFVKLACIVVGYYFLIKQSNEINGTWCVSLLFILTASMEFIFDIPFGWFEDVNMEIIVVHVINRTHERQSTKAWGTLGFIIFAALMPLFLSVSFGLWIPWVVWGKKFASAALYSFVTTVLYMIVGPYADRFKEALLPIGSFFGIVSLGISGSFAFTNGWGLDAK